MMVVLYFQVHTYVNTPGLQEERHGRSGGHTPLDFRLSNPDSMGPASSIETETARLLMEPESVKFVLGPTPVQRQMLLKERQHECEISEAECNSVCPSMQTHTESVNGCSGPAIDCDTGYDSDDRREPSQEQQNGLISRRPQLLNPSNPISPASDTHSTVGQRRTALLNYENLPALPPVWELRKPPSKGPQGAELKSPALNGFDPIDPQHNYVNTENVMMPLSANRPRESNFFSFDLRRVPAAEAFRQLNYIEVEMDKGSDSSGPQTPKTPTTPLPQTPTQRTELYAVIDIERTAAMSSLQKAQPRDDGTARKTRHNSTDLPM